MEQAINPLTQQPLTNEQLQHVAGLAERQLKLEERIAKGEKLLGELKDELNIVSTELIPAALDDIGMDSFTLKNGAKVQVKPFYAGKISDENKEEAFKWLRQHGFGSLIKREISAKFGKGQDKLATMALEALEKLGCDPGDKTSVHPQTLKAFIKEQVEAGKNLPTDLLGVFVGKVTKVTPAK